MAYLLILIAVLLPMLFAAAFLLGRMVQKRQDRGDELSAVTRQHIDLFQGGQLNEDAVESVKARFRSLLERGEVAAVEASIRPGTQFVFQVRALAELGTDVAGRILERQLHRRLTEDQLEQAWYWIDLANGLRTLNRSQSLPQLLHCSENAGELPLGHFLAAETVCFLGFSGYLRQVETPLGTSALRVLHQAMEGLRHGVQPQVVIESRLGETIEILWDHRPEPIHPLTTRIFLEALRVVRRAPHAEVLLSSEMAEQEAFSWQISRLEALAGSLIEYLEEAPSQLCDALERLPAHEHGEYLHALSDLRADAAKTLLRLIAEPGYAHADLAAEALTWSKGKEVGQTLMSWARRYLDPAQRAAERPRLYSPRRPSTPPELPYRQILRALRGHGSIETEAFLVQATSDWDPAFRAASFSSLGWWEPFQRGDVLKRLQHGRRDPNPDVRQAARGALGRLGERQALQWFRSGLASEDLQKIHEAIQTIVLEGLTLLWPDLDRLADSEDLEIAHHAREALERLSEDMDGLIR